MSGLFRIDLLNRSISLFIHFIFKMNNEISHEKLLYFEVLVNQQNFRVMAFSTISVSINCTIKE